MKQGSLNRVLRAASALYHFDVRDAVAFPRHTGGRNIVYRLDAARVLRVSKLRDRTPEDYLAETEYIHYLAANGAPVTDVLPSVNGRNVEMIAEGEDRFAVSVFQTAQGDQIAAHGYQYREGAPLEEYWFNTGKALGCVSKFGTVA